MLVSTTIVLSSVLALAPFGKGDEAPTKEVGGGIAGIACACTGDLDGNGVVDAADLALILGQWGGVGSADLDGDGLILAGDLAILLGAWGPCATSPENDNCLDSTPIGVGSHPFCTIGANTDGPAYANGSSCSLFGYNQVFADVWYTFTAIGDGTLTIDTCGTDFDTRLAVYGSILPGPIGCPSSGISLVNLLACNDDSACGLASKIELDVIGGRTYKIRVGGFNGFSGNGVLNVDFTSAGSSCLDAIPVLDVSNTTVFGTTLDNAVGQDVSPCGIGDTIGEWYSFENTCPNENATITISTCDDATDFDTVLSVWKQGMDGCTSQIVACNDDASGATCTLNGLVRKSRVSFTMSPGAIYFVRVAGYQGADGDFALKFTTESCN
jgi:hypothetical protein